MKLTIEELARELNVPVSDVKKTMRKLHISGRRGWLYLDEQDDIRIALGIKHTSIDKKTSSDTEDETDIEWGKVARVAYIVGKTFFGG